jgi:hypothetical protein
LTPLWQGRYRRFNFIDGIPTIDGHLDPRYVWQVDLVRTLHGGPEQYVVLRADQLRPATDGS